MRAPGLGAAARPMDMPGFDAWTQERSIQAQYVSHAMFEVGSAEQRGVAADKDLAEGETIVQVPRDSAVSLLRAEKSPSADLAAFWDAHPQWYVRLGSKLLLERELGRSSSVSGYIDLLPKPDECTQFPVEWTDDEVAMLRYEKVEAAVAKQRLKWQEILADFRRLCPQRSAWTDCQLRWSWHMSLSRAFAGNFGGGMLSFVAVFGLLAELSALTTAATDCDYALIPMIDSCNHDGRLPSTSLDFSPLTRTFTLKASKGGVRKGEQVFITYGALGNDELLQRFGFAETGCQHDSFDISKNQIAAAMQVEGGRDEIECELIDRGLGATCMDTLVLKPRGQVDKQMEVELALGMLFGDDSKGVAGLERASKKALKQICEFQIAEMTAPQETNTNEVVELARIWREAKCSVLRDTLLSTAKFL